MHVVSLIMVSWWVPLSIDFEGFATFMFPFIPNTPLHQDDALFPGNRLPLLPCYSIPSSPFCPMPLAAFTASPILFPSPKEVSALPRCQLWKEFWHDCVTLMALWRVQMVWNGLGWAKQEKEKDYAQKSVICSSDLHGVKKDTINLSDNNCMDTIEYFLLWYFCQWNMKKNKTLYTACD